jgi:hypothetical protein
MTHKIQPIFNGITFNVSVFIKTFMKFHFSLFLMHCSRSYVVKSVLKFLFMPQTDGAMTMFITAMEW